jgi:SAM-dependent methyltransferase
MKAWKKGVGDSVGGRTPPAAKDLRSGNNADLRDRWERSYRHRQNFLFSPNEEVIRFTARYIRKRVGINRYENAGGSQSPVRVLDLGCGIGRHVIYLAGLGVEVYGLDLSAEAVRIARHWAVKEGFPDVSLRVVQGDVRRLPWPLGYFHHIISHGVLDSMPWGASLAAVTEAARVLKPGGFFYCDLVSGDDSRHAREFAGVEVVRGAHEEGTVQSYFNFGKIERLFEGCFTLRDAHHIQREDIQKGHRSSRYHLVLEKGPA